MAKKKKGAEIDEAAGEGEIQAEVENGVSNVDDNKKKKKKLKKEAEHILKEDEEVPTVSIAVAGSIIDNAQSLELATRVTPCFRLCDF